MNNTTRIAVIFLLMFLAAVPALGQAPAADSAEQQITATLHQMYEAEKRKDLDFVLAHLAEDFTEVAGDGNVYHRQDVIDGWKDVRLNDYKLTDCIFKLFAADAAYLSCRMEVDATFKGKAFPQRFRVTYLWTRRGDDWQVRFEQATLIPEPPKP